MTKLKWDQTGEKLYETGVSNGVLYLTDENGKFKKATAWNGLTKVSEAPSGAETTSLYADNAKYLNLVSAEEFGFTIEAYTYPDEFAQCDGSAELATGITVGQQTRKTFGFSYKTLVGNDVKGDEFGYKLHIVYGCKASPSSKDYQSVNDSPEAMSLSWEVKTTPVPVPNMKPTATVIIDSTKITPEKLKLVEDALYGTESEEAYLPTPEELIALVS